MKISLSPIVALTFALLSDRARASDPIDLERNADEALALCLRTIEAHEYEIAEDADGVLGAPNRAHQLRLAFKESGMFASPRGDTCAAFEWGLRTLHYGRADQVTTLDPATPTAQANRVEYAHPGIVEWYVNRRDGLEHGYTLASKPAGSRELFVDIAILGNLSPRARDGGIDFLRAEELVVRYDKLVVFDASGATIPSRMDQYGDRLRITVDDSVAVYPLTIDPLATTASWVAEGNKTNALFGFHVATAGDVNGDGYSDVAIGAPYFDGLNGDGRVFVFHGSATGLGANAAWVSGNELETGSFGFAVSTAGDVNDDGYSDLIVGAPFFANGQVGEGRTLLFLGSATGLASTPSWTYESNSANASLGTSVSTCGDLDGDGFSEFAIGAPGFTNGQSNEGRVFVFRGSTTGLPTTPSWTNESDFASASFGAAVAWAGDVNGDGFSDLAVGAPGYSNGQTSEGRAYVYHGKVSLPTVAASWTYESNQQGATLGASIATAGDTDGNGFSDLVVGAPGMDGTAPSTQLNEGVVFVFSGGTGGLTSGPVWSFESDVPQARVGSSVATAGDVNGDGWADLIVGAEQHDDEGRAYLFAGSTSGLTLTLGWEFSSGQPGSLTGRSVGTAGDVNGDGFSDVIVSAHGFDGGHTDEGRALVFHGRASHTSGVVTTNESNQAGASHGAAVAYAGDVNGDGFADVIVGAPDRDGVHPDGGRASIYFGSKAGIPSTANWFDDSNQAAAKFGGSVASAGDVDGDGYSDVILGAPSYDNPGQVDAGAAHLYRGSAIGPENLSSWSVDSDQAGAELGGSVASAGDVNGDGYADVIVGARSFDGPVVDGGRAYVYLGSSSGLSGTPAWTVDGDQAQADFASAVASAGDVDLDGYCDVAVGAPAYDYFATGDGHVFIYRGTKSGVQSAPYSRLFVQQASANFGKSVGTAGDVNGDGYSDLIVGAPLYDAPDSSEGRAFVYHGPFDGLMGPTYATWTGESDQAGAQFGLSVGTAGDVNGDGLSDIVVGARFFDDGQSNEGRAYVYLGTPNGVSPIAVWTTDSNQVSAEYGAAVGTAGDVNGDGYADVVVGAPKYDNGLTDEGRAFVFLGNGGAGFASMPRAVRENGHPLPEGGTAFSSKFRVSTVARSAIARSDVKLEVESRAAADENDALVTTVSSSWKDSTLVGTKLGLDAGPFPDGQYQWRSRVRHRLSSHPFQPHGPWFHAATLGAEQASVRVRALPPILAVDSLAPISIAYVRGDALPSSVWRWISNVGGSELYFAAGGKPFEWISASSAYDSSLLPGESPTPVLIKVHPESLPSGIHAGKVTFSNLVDIDQTETIPIQLTIVEKMFIPGDTLVANFESGYGDEETASFEAVAGMKLKLTFPAVPQSFQALVRIDEPGGAPLTNFIVTLGSKKVKKQVTVPSSGLHTLRIEPLTALFTPISIATTRTLPGAAGSVSKTLKPKQGALAAWLPFQALPGAVLDLTLSKKKFSGAASVELKLPSGASFDLSSFTQTLANGDLVLTAVPLSQLGAHEILVSGYATDKETLKAKLTLTQPPEGSATVDMP